jgi:hypothetical protein
MTAPINSALIATIRQEFLGGESLRALAAKHGISLRTLASRSKNENWNQQRDLQRSATQLPAVAGAADRRAAQIAKDWKGRLGPLLDRTGEIADRVTELLSQADLSGADFRDLATLLKLLTDAMGKLSSLATEHSSEDKPVPPIYFALAQLADRQCPELPER